MEAFSNGTVNQLQILSKDSLPKEGELLRFIY